MNNLDQRPLFRRSPLPERYGYSDWLHHLWCKALDISMDGGPSIAATAENALKGDYPLARYLYVYVNKKPGEPLQPIAREFLT